MAKKKKPLVVDDIPSDEAETATVKGGDASAIGTTGTAVRSINLKSAPIPKVIAVAPTLGTKLPP